MPVLQVGMLGIWGGADVLILRVEGSKVGACKVLRVDMLAD
jgi:hypothetical protein